MKPAKGLVLVVIIVATLIGGAWYGVAGTPQYSLYRLSQAVRAHDAATAERYIDFDQVADDAAETLIEFVRSERRAEALPAGSEWEELGRQLAEGLIELMLPAVKARARDEFRSQFRRAVEEGNSESRFLTMPSQVRDLRAKVTVQRDGKRAIVSVSDKGEIVSKFRMIQQPNRQWRIVALDREWLMNAFRKSDR